jgi:hypothetical protein
MTPNAKYQAAYRARYVKRGGGLARIIIELEGNDKPLAAKLRAIAEEALK